MLASRPAAATLLRPVLWVGSMTDIRPAADIGPGEENLLGEASVGQLVRFAGPPDEFSGSYLMFSVAWRSITLFTLVWLVAAYRQLDAARREFRDQAVVRDRLRIQSELRRGLGRALESIVARSSRASAAA